MHRCPVVTLTKIDEPSTSRRRWTSRHTAKASLVALLAVPGAGLIATPAMAQLSFQTFQFDSSTITTVTGIRANNMTGNYSIANSGGSTGGLLFGLSTGSISPFPTATANGSNFPGAISSTPYGPNFGSAAGILRVVGSYKTAASNPNDLGYLYDGAPTSGQQITTLFYPGASTINTIPHSNFGNQVVGNYDTILATGNAFIYDIPSGTYTTNNRPGAVSTTAYGVYGNRIAGGSTDPGPGGVLHGYIYNQSTGAFTMYDAPGVGTVATHFEGITSGGRANTFNLVADSVDLQGNVHAWAVHVDANGVATWTEIAVPGAAVTSANSVYGNTVIGVYVLGGVTRAYLTNIPGSFYNPITNTGSLTASAPNAAAISVAGDDVVNSGSILATGANGMGISSGTYGVVTNSGAIGATGAGGTAVQMTGTFGTLLNSGLISAAPGAIAIGSNSTSVGTVVVNAGTIDGQVAIAAGPLCPLREQRLAGHQRGRRRRHPHDERHLRADLARHVGPARRIERHLRPIPRQRPGATCRNGADGLPAGQQLRQELHPAVGNQRLDRHVRRAGDAEPAGLPERQPGLRRQQRVAVPAIVDGLDAGPRRQPDLRRAGARHGLQRRSRSRRHAGPVRPVARSDAVRADGAVRQQCQRRTIVQHGGGRPVRRAHGQVGP